MQPFVFHNPTEIVFGVDTADKVGKYAARQGGKALLVYGRNSIKTTGLYDRVTASLQAAGLSWVDHGGVKSNPVLSHVREGVAVAKREQVDVVVAVGGGSVLDESKAIAAGALCDHDVWEFFLQAKVEKALPLVTVLTLAATGSEMNSGGVVTNENTAQKFNIGSPLLFPKTSILDPALTYTVPADYTAYSAVDAISHIIEGYFTSNDQATPLQDRFVEGLVKTIMESTEQILQQPDHADARATMMWSATWALNGLSTAGIGLYQFPNHMIEHSLSAMYDIAHGAGLSIVIPGWMDYAATQNPAKFAQFARRVFDCELSDDLECARYGIEALKTWFHSIGSPVSLAQGNIPDEEIGAIADNAVMLARKWGLKAYTAEVIADILSRCRS
ncbi:iron-containing alcohol dehydrogenase [Desulfuromonas acetoxidans]|uniref:Iron-containing alcohol dehydrogenase n=1 Tax=Desulfuromonas acetoxidans (strain DSM 684 / 11070) TaxID=281689 RepID=Q1JYE4_DESA6|nr:iron-containing alcohol dehydrogenase [Desulfuromonas acetoxidans]EAT15262.1 iron-containing alcohol dehydrogenase [Desulfuromonas acetoxidans DSM 684]MBF0645352.1 iron-containing alcohol dehydrogenase [Desulfuromonas acetoxidans]NVD23432.1 iron-containing alcohol dehydrogenase [Desulfuromonas acetoxidans]NVE15327.1 iron-containing alcohol dehydrogenase [Desulfuromonas acetoxidans]